MHIHSSPADIGFHSPRVLAYLFNCLRADVKMLMLPLHTSISISCRSQLALHRQVTPTGSYMLQAPAIDGAARRFDSQAALIGHFMQVTAELTSPLRIIQSNPAGEGTLWVSKHERPYSQLEDEHNVYTLVLANHIAAAVAERSLCSTSVASQGIEEDPREPIV